MNISYRAILSGLICLFLINFTLVQDSEQEGQDEEQVKQNRDDEAQSLFLIAAKNKENGNLRECAMNLNRLLVDYRFTRYVKRNYRDIMSSQLEVINQVVAGDFSGHYDNILNDPYTGFSVNIPAEWVVIPALHVNFMGNQMKNMGNQRRREEVLRFTIISPYSNSVIIRIYVSDNDKSLNDAVVTISKEIRRPVGDAVEPEKINDMEYISNTTEKKGYYIRDCYLFNELSGKGIGFSIHWGLKNEGTKGVIDKVVSAIISSLKFTKAQHDHHHHGNGMELLHIPPEQIPGWKIYETKKFRIIYDFEDEFAHKVGEQLEIISKLYEEVLPATDKQKGDVKGTVRIFADRFQREQYMELPSQVEAFYNFRSDEVLGYRSRLKAGDSYQRIKIPDYIEETTLNILYHEVFHMYVDFFFVSVKKDVRFPPWINEGLGDYFAGAVINGKGEIEDVKPNFLRSYVIRGLARSKRFIPLKKLLSYSLKDYYQNPSVSYAMGWALCYFILEYEGENNEVYKDFLRQLLVELKTSSNWRESTFNLIKKLDIDLDKLEEQWLAFFEKKFSRKNG